jgi:DNA modification methylase
VWDKGPMGMGWHYRRSYETVLVGEKPGAACRWFDETCAVENIIRPNAYGIRKIIPSVDQHPTEKCVQLPAHFIGLHTQPGDVVLDPFCGRGSTVIAAIRADRQAVGIELDPVHFDKCVEKCEAELNRFPLLEPAPKAVQRELLEVIA